MSAGVQGERVKDAYRACVVLGAWWHGMRAGHVLAQSVSVGVDDEARWSSVLDWACRVSRHCRALGIPAEVERQRLWTEIGQ